MNKHKGTHLHDTKDNRICMLGVYSKLNKLEHRWMDQVMRAVEKRGKKWTQVKQDREWEDRDRWRFLCKSRPKKLETT
jgi:hypothetical protein